MDEYRLKHSMAVARKMEEIAKNMNLTENEIKNQPTIHQDTHQDTHQDKILEFCKEPRTTKEIMAYIGLNDRRNFYLKYMRPLLYSGKLQMTIPDKPNTKNQRYITKN